MKLRMLNSIMNAGIFAATAIVCAAQTVPVSTAAPAVAAGAPAAAVITAKKPGVVRIGIAVPAYDLGGGQGGAESVRTLEEQLLTSPKIEVVKITSLLPVQATAEAKAADCDYILTSAVNQKVKTGGFGGLKTFSSLAPVASMVPGVSSAAGMAGMAAAHTATVIANGVKARAEVSFEYSLNTATGSNVLQSVEKVKAKTDGEDVLTSLVQQAATKIVTTVIK
jgi:hypothetical protein